MNDPMQEMVCPHCGEAEVHEEDTWFGKVWCCWGCDGRQVDPETRAEYLAALEDQGREDR